MTSQLLILMSKQDPDPSYILPYPSLKRRWRTRRHTVNGGGRDEVEFPLLEIRSTATMLMDESDCVRSIRGRS